MTLLESGNACAPVRALPTVDGGLVAGGPPRPAGDRPRVDGKFLAVGDERLSVRGVT